MEASWSTFLFETANFVLLVALLSWLFFAPIRRFVSQREEAFAAERAQAEALHRNAESEREQAQALHKQANDLLAQQRLSLEKHRRDELERVKRELQSFAEQERERLEHELDARRRTQQQEWLEDVAAWTSQLTARLLERIRGPELTRALVVRACEELVRLRAERELSDIVFELAEPLEDDELERLAASAGIPRSQLTTREAPELIAGLRMVSSQGTIDASALGVAGHVQRELAAKLERAEASRAQPE